MTLLSRFPSLFSPFSFSFSFSLLGRDILPQLQRVEFSSLKASIRKANAIYTRLEQLSMNPRVSEQKQLMLALSLGFASRVEMLLHLSGLLISATHI
jgi:hypothetical protein